MRKPILLVTLALLLALPAAAFTDVAEDHWAAGAIEEMAAAHVTTGYPDGTFRPGDTVSRAQFLAMTVRVCADETVPLAEDGQDWWQPYVDAAAELGMLADGLFPAGTDFQAPITRGEMARLLLGADEALGLWDGAVLDTAGLAAFPDTDGAEAEAAALSAATGLLTGYPDGTFLPEKTVTRAESCVVLQRLTGHGDLLDEDETLVWADGTYLVKYAQPKSGSCTLTCLRLSDGAAVDTAAVPRETYTDADGDRVSNAPRPMLAASGSFFWGYGGLWQVDGDGQLLQWTEEPVIDCALLADGSAAVIVGQDGVRPVDETGAPWGVRVVQLLESGFSAPLTSGDTEGLTAIESRDGQLLVTADGVVCTLKNGQLIPIERTDIEKG